MQDSDVVQLSVVEWLNSVDYDAMDTYVPTEFAAEFVNFIKLVNGAEGTENKTPVIHLKMLDSMVDSNGLDVINLCHRGAAKSTVAEYLFLYLAVMGELPTFGEVLFAIYVSDSIDNGVKKMRKNLEFRYYNSPFLQKYIPTIKFTDIRWEFIRADGTSLVVCGYGASTGVRGPLSLDSKVYTDTGTKTIAEVKVGDKVFTPAGKETVVTGKSEVFHDPMYKLTFDDGRVLKCDGTHLHPLYVKVDKRIDGKRVTKHEKRLFTTQQLLEGKPLTNGTNRRYFTKAVEPVEYSTENLPIDPYLLGILLGDGNMPSKKSVRLSGLEDDVDSYLARVNYPEVTEVPFLERSGMPMKRVTFRGLHKGIADIGLAGKKDIDKFIPAIYQRGSVVQRRALLAGLLDTDGTCSKEGGVSYSTVSKDLCAGITDLARSLGYLVRSNVIKRKGRNPLYRIYIRGSVNPFYLDRKAKLFRVPTKRSDRVALVSIDRIEDEPSQCIRVEDGVHEFITDNYLATHNTRENGSRPVLAVLDDLISDEDARSPTVLAAVEDTVYKAIDYALHPNKRKIIWSGTPFNASDPLYKAVESGAWNVNVYPVCEKFPCSEEEFKGSWPDRFNYAYVMKQYTKARLSGKIDTFNQELMLRIISDEERLVLDTDINWYNRNGVLHNKGMFNFYITTDFATSDKKSADYSVISVWALNSNGDWFWVDGICKKQHMDTNVDDLFRLVQLYRPQSVGIEVSGQQGGFVSLIQRKMIDTGIFFTLAQDVNGNKVGIRPTVDKSKRFLDSVHPLFKSRKFYFPKELKEAPIMVEAMLELSLATHKGFKSKHDDFIDTISMLTSMRTFCPSADLAVSMNSDSGDSSVVWDFDYPEDDFSNINSYVV